ncbi:hypothetical protein MLD38_010312 [Melastoma candidum]|uniref:Uncharacterized protein n=1 Tax=Melastoma candidum TaxID=119954 RepID=A0ACB9QZH1_9MYRT|nr:hypothetical protein MLD38_010312 [Melastoma candidum]
MGTRNNALLAVLVVSAVLLSAGPTVALPESSVGDSTRTLPVSVLVKRFDLAAVCQDAFCRHLPRSVKGFVKGEPSLISVLNAEVDACAKETKAAIAKVEKLSKAASSGEKKTLSICKENYEFAIDSLENVRKAISARDLGTLNAELGAVVTYASTCDDAYSESKYVSPLTEVDQTLMGLGSNCLEMAAQIDW